MTQEAEVDSLRAISPRASLLQDGPLICVLLPETRLITAAGLQVMDTLLCPLGQGSYTTRLLLDRQVTTGQPLNWCQIMVLGRTWWTWSWNHVPTGLPWLQVFAEHARLLK